MAGSHAGIEDDRLIRELLQNWAIWRDAGDWERFRTVWHPDGRMMATWTQGTGDEFIEISKAIADRAGSIPPPAVRTLDAIHLASALRVGARQMLVYDRRLAEAAAGAGLDVLSPGA